MAVITDILIKTELRPCYVNEKKALFHRWIDKEEVMLKFHGLICEDELENVITHCREKSVLPPNVNAEKVRNTFAIVEYEDGTIDEVRPQQIKFADNKINELAF